MRKGLLVALCASVLSFGFGVSEAQKQVSDTESQKNKIEYHMREEVKKVLENPSSAKFRNQNEVCGEVNSKNSLGEYTGFKKFMAKPANKGKGIKVILEGNGQLDDDTFYRIWELRCQ